MSPGRHTARDLTVGIVVTLAAVVFAAGIFSIGSEQRLWTRKVTYRLRLPDVNGLLPGSPVRLIGVQVGTVTDVRLPEDPNVLDIEVQFSVDASVQSRIREDTEATLKVLSLLAGDRFIELTPGSPSAPALPPGGYVKVPQGLSIEQLQELGATIADDLQGVVASLKVILEQLQDPNTIIGQALFDPNFGRETLGSLKESMRATTAILKEIESGRGLAGRLLTDEEFADTTLARVTGSLDRMDALLARLSDEEGALMRALAPDGALAASLDNLEAASEKVRGLAGELEEGRGLAGRLMTDDAFAQEVLDNLRETSRGLREIVERINRGEGTAGAFINDPAIYQDLKDVLGGVRKSRFMSWLIRHYREKGEEERMKEERRGSPGGGDGAGEGT